MDTSLSPMERPVFLYQNSSDKSSAEHESSPTEWCVMWNDCKGSSYSFAAYPRGIQGATTTASRSTTSRQPTDCRIEWHDSSPSSAPGFNRGAHAREASAGQEAKWCMGRREPLPSSAAGAATGSRQIAGESKEAEQDTWHIEWFDSSAFASFFARSASSSFDSPAGPVGLEYTSATGAPEAHCEIEWHGAGPWAESADDADAAECVCVLLPDGSVQLFPSPVFGGCKSKQQVAASDVLSLFPSHSLLPLQPASPGSSGVARAPAAAALPPAQQLSSSCVYELVQAGHARCMQPPNLSSRGGAHCSSSGKASAGYSCRSPRCLAHWPLRGLLWKDCALEKEAVEGRLEELQGRRQGKEQEPFSVLARQPTPRGSARAPKDESNNSRRWGMFPFGSAKSILQSTCTSEGRSMAEAILPCSKEVAGNHSGHARAVPQGLVKDPGFRRRALLRTASGW